MIIIVFLGLMLLIGCTSTNAEKKEDTIIEKPEQLEKAPESLKEETKNENIEKNKKEELPPPVPTEPIEKIKSIYIIDLETGEQAEELIAGKAYEIIAENDKPFIGYVNFVLFIDGNKVDEYKALCPQQCASDKMYSIPLTIQAGNYRTLKVFAEDASSAEGESYEYKLTRATKTEYTAISYCDTSETVPTVYCSKLQTKTISSEGGTISDGWPEGTNFNPYDVENSFEDVCDEMRAKGTNGFFSHTNCEYEPYICFENTPTPNRETCKCDCTVSVTSIDATPAISVKFPNWAKYNSATAAQKVKWDEFIRNLKTHEEGHIRICKEGKTTIETGIDSPSESASGANCEEACTKAKTALDGEINNRFNQAFQQISDEDDTYDTTTQHGKTQGATLVCRRSP